MSDRPVITQKAAAVGRAWWAPTMGRMTVQARIATSTVAAALLAITLIVWTSPAGTVPGTATAEAVTLAPSATEVALAKENAAMLAELQTSRSQANGLRDALTQEQAGRLKGAQDKAAAEAEKAAAATAKPATSSTARTTAKTATTSTPASSAPGSGAANPTNPTQPAGPGTPVVTKPAAPTKADLLNPTSRYFGMYTAQAPFSFATFDDSATKLGHAPNLVGYFSGWDKPFRADAVSRSWDRGMLPMLTWESRPSDAPNDVVDEPDYTLPMILAGTHDDYLRQYARDVASLGLPLAIRLDHEMNGIWYPWAERTSSGASINGNSPGQYAAMWKHVHDIFEAEGANQYVIWVWSPNIINNLPATLQSQGTLAGLYPGDDYVDWVGLSGYDRPPYKADNNATFDYTFGRSLAQLRQLTPKKILISEVGASEIGGHKPAWVTSFFTAFHQPANSDLLGFAWFNMAVSTYSAGALITNDWRVDSRHNTLEAFVAGLNDPVNNFGGQLLAAGPSVEPDPQTAPDALLALTPTATPAPTATPTVAATPTATPKETP
ncbi:MAG: glycoside hydrolase family 26 protein [Cellulomonas sp.]